MTLLEQTALDIGGGWTWCKLSLRPESGFSITDFRLFIASGDGSNSYPGDTSKGVDLLATGAEQTRMVTTPILDGGATRNTEDLDVNVNLNDEEFTFFCELEIPTATVHDFGDLFYFAQNDRIEFKGTNGNLSLIFYHSNPQIPFSVSSYERVRLALSLSSNEARFAVSGEVKTETYNGDALGVNNIGIWKGQRNVVLNIYNLSTAPEFFSITDLESLTTVV